MAPSILLISAGTEFAREVYEREGRVEWAQAMPLVLEKLGYLGVRMSGPEALADPAVWERHAAILVPRLPEGAWSPEAIDLAAEGRARALIDLPPASLRRHLGISSSEPVGRNGVVTAVDPELVAAVEGLSVRSNTRLEPPQSRPVDRRDDLGWRDLEAPIADEQAERWRGLAWDVQRWQVAAGAQVLADWTETVGGGRSWPALVRSGSLVGCCFSMLSYLGQQTTVEPFAGAEHLIWQRSTALEAMLCALLDAMHRDSGVARPRVLPWPAGADWVLNVRHDFDRAQSRKQVDRMLDVHAEAGTAATWYWRARHVSERNTPAKRIRSLGSNGAAVVRRVAAGAAHEVAHHTEQLWAPTEERQILERAVGRPMQGTSAHGDPDCFRWQGAPNVLWAEEQGYDYTEFISHAHLHPHRFASVDGEGAVALSRIVCLPHHESFDRSTKPGDAATDSVLAAADSYVRSGGMMQVLNHPDLNVDELADLLARLPSVGRLDWTAAQVADWWRRTHVADELTIEQDAGGAEFTVRSARGVQGVVLEVIDPDGSRRRFALHIEAGGSVKVGGGESGEVAEVEAADGAGRWATAVAPAFVKAARAYYEEQGIDADSPVARSTIDTNSSLVPSRVGTVRRYLSELGGLSSLSGRRVLDCGAGFGAFAAYLSLGADPPSVTAIDARPDFAELAGGVGAEVGLTDVDYRVGDMRNLEGIGSASIDIVIVNNAFIYLPSPEEMEASIRAMSRVLAPGGRVCLFHANRWQLREPFTRAPLVHLMPPPVAAGVARTTGWKHNHGRVRLISAPSLQRILSRNGFERIRTGALAGGRIIGPPRSYFARFYAVVAHRAG